MTKSGACPPSWRNSAGPLPAAITLWPTASRASASASRALSWSSTKPMRRARVVSCCTSTVASACHCPKGSSIANTEPRPSREHMRTCRPISAAALATMEIPKPLPRTLRAALNGENSSTMVCACLGCIPAPLSQTSIQWRPCRCRSASSTPPVDVCWIALARKLPTIRVNKPRSV